MRFRLARELEATVRKPLPALLLGFLSLIMARLAASLAAVEPLRMRMMKDTAPTEMVGCAIDGGQESKM